ncbi:MAG TPA: hypothetical protein VMM36_10665 [Opitutaceae bacterium]|nr:hypothetical protein [Opitutaceae bacterium]
MKDKRFLELVNVYLDGEISEVEAVELEGEIRSSAKRMDLYRRYCRMQKACMMIAEESRSATTTSESAVVHLPEARRSWLLGQWWRGGVYGGTAAIAATIILVISMSGPAELADSPDAVPAVSGSAFVQIPVGEFARPNAIEPRLEMLTERWDALTRFETATMPTHLGTLARTPEFNQHAPIVTEWSSNAVFPERGPLEFRYRTNSVSGERVLHGQPRTPEGEIEFATFEFAR